VQKEVVEATALRPDISIIVIWMPMVETDSQAEAVKASAMFEDSRVAQFYDPHRVVGIDYVKGAFANCLRDALSVLPKEDELRSMVEHWNELAPEHRALWDVVLFYPPGVEWKTSAPAPKRWAKQVMYFEGGEKTTGTFFRDDCKKLPIDSDWHVLLRETMADFPAASTRPRVERVELLAFPGCPHADVLRKNVVAALAELGIKTVVTETNLESLPREDPRRGFGSPTVLVNGQDLFDAKPESSGHLRCRLYPGGGVPSIADTRRAGPRSGRS
jgi:hypothetical protein